MRYINVLIIIIQTLSDIKAEVMLVKVTVVICCLICYLLLVILSCFSSYLWHIEAAYRKRNYVVVHHKFLYSVFCISY